MKRGTLLKNYAHVFALMLRLRQLCCHRELLPAVDPDKDYGGDDVKKLKRLAEQLRDMIKEGTSDECSICLSEFNSPVITQCAHVYCRPCITQYIDSTPNPPAMCPLCRSAVTADKLLEAASSNDEDTVENDKTEAFEDIIVNVSNRIFTSILILIIMLKRCLQRK
jgi:SWI/SNF-related matrix-associated actin-dependent regulator of chromatin subfamily A3